jgi:metallo-beta-lactamase family protein
MMKIRFCGAAGMVTGSMYHISCGKKQFLVDCGMFQGNKVTKENKYRPFKFYPQKIDYVFLTHAHIVHTGLIPKLTKAGFRGPIYTTDVTVELLKYMLPDSANIQAMEVEQKNRRLLRKGEAPIVAIYTEADAKQAIKQLTPIVQDQLVKIAPELSVKFHNAGHILCSSFIEMFLTDKTTNKTGEKKERRREKLFSRVIASKTLMFLPMPTISW